MLRSKGVVESGPTRPSQGQMVTHVVNDRVLDAAEALAGALAPDARLDGVKLDLRLPLRSFVNDELASQQLVDSSVVLLDRNRIQVQLDR